MLRLILPLLVLVSFQVSADISDRAYRVASLIEENINDLDQDQKIEIREHFNSIREIINRDQNSNTYLSSCLKAAKEAGYSTDRSDRVCTNAKRSTVNCIRAAKEAGYSFDRNERVCTNAKRGTVDCIRAAKEAGYSFDRSERVCTNATRATGDCIKAADEARYSYDRSERVCTPKE